MAHEKITEDEQRAQFLEHLSQTGHVSDSCKKGRLPRRTAYNWRKTDKDFAKAWDEALELGTDALEDEAIRRAKKGVLRPIYQGGKKVGTIREFSDTLMIFMLKGRRREKYGDRREITGRDGGPIRFLSERDLAKLTDEQLEQLESIYGAIEGNDPPPGT